MHIEDWNKASLSLTMSDTKKEPIHWRCLTKLETKDRIKKSLNKFWILNMVFLHSYHKIHNYKTNLGESWTQSQRYPNNKRKWLIKRSPVLEH